MTSSRAAQKRRQNPSPPSQPDPYVAAIPRDDTHCSERLGDLRPGVEATVPDSAVPAARQTAAGNGIRATPDRDGTQMTSYAEVAS
ncbi:MAG: hypothetical protein ACLQME_07595 [Alphaproteobacteria bacterium]